MTSPSSLPGIGSQATCPFCGRPSHPHERDYRFLLPDRIAEFPEAERTAGVWMNDSTPEASAMITTADNDGYLRILLPVQLTGGFTVVYGIWASVPITDLKAAFDVYWEPEYADLRLTGRIANSIPPWGLRDAPVCISVRDQDEAPYAVASPDPQLNRVLSDQWAHDLVLGAIDL